MTDEREEWRRRLEARRVREAQSKPPRDELWEQIRNGLADQYRAATALWLDENADAMRAGADAFPKPAVNVIPKPLVVPETGGDGRIWGMIEMPFLVSADKKVIFVREPTRPRRYRLHPCDGGFDTNPIADSAVFFWVERDPDGSLWAVVDEPNGDADA
jgi:hypothetical protein